MTQPPSNPSTDGRRDPAHALNRSLLELRSAVDRIDMYLFNLRKRINQVERQVNEFTSPPADAQAIDRAMTRSPKGA